MWYVGSLYLKYFPHRCLAKLIGRILVAQHHLLVCTRKHLSHSFHTRVAIFKALLRTFSQVHDNNSEGPMA
jgi:hypothetical protein